MRNQLKSLTIKGYKTIQSLEGFEPRPINILIGSNGAGKSNFISFFHFMSWLFNSDGKLQEHVAYLGGANDILFDGADVTRNIEAAIDIQTQKGLNSYKFTLMYAKPDRLIFKEELYRFMAQGSLNDTIKWSSCGVGHAESKLPSVDNLTAKTITLLMKQLIVYQFFNTSDTSNMRQRWSIDDGKWLKQNGDNLGSFLYWIQQHDTLYYNRIVKYLRLLLPFFDDFKLYDEFGKILLRWNEKGSSKIFNVGQASDGMLRTIALVSLLAQNPKNLPDVLFFDEPELGLHPSAIDTVSGLIKAASEHCQIFMATQSLSLVNNFELEDLVVIDRPSRASTYSRPNSETLKEYLDEFSVGQIWEKNIIGGRP